MVLTRLTRIVLCCGVVLPSLWSAAGNAIDNPTACLAGEDVDAKETKEVMMLVQRRGLHSNLPQQAPRDVSNGTESALVVRLSNATVAEKPAGTQGKMSVGEGPAIVNASRNAAFKSGDFVVLDTPSTNDSSAVAPQQSDSLAVKQPTVDAMQPATDSQATMPSNESWFQQQLEYTFHVQQQAPSVSKTLLSVVSIIGLGFCGVDRCLMGQYACGVLKAITVGGCGIWWLMDYCIITFNCLAKWDRMDALAMKAKFPKDTVDAAFWITVVGLLLKCLCGSRHSPDPK